MIRPCFLCAGTVEVLVRARWNLLRLPGRDLGFGLCEDCGLVLQSPALEPELLRRWYAECAVYTGPGRGGEPHANKVRAADRLVAMVEHAMGSVPPRVFQVGSSDGYTLSRLASAGAVRVAGVDPSPASCELAAERYGLDLHVGSFEELEELPQSDLWVLTHVLEHLLDPLAVLRRIRARSDAGWVAVEVPLFERPEALPPGYLSVEHVNYFTEESLTRMLALAGYRVVGLAKEYEADLYPVVAATARPVEAPAVVESGPGEREEVRRRLAACIERDRALWRGVDRQLRAEVERGARVHVWGAGVFASQLLANTDLARRAELVGAVDSSPQKQGATLGDLPVVAPGAAGLGPGDCVVIASFASADEIWRQLAPERSRGVRVVRLHGESIGR